MGCEVAADGVVQAAISATSVQYLIAVAAPNPSVNVSVLAPDALVVNEPTIATVPLGLASRYQHCGDGLSPDMIGISRRVASLIALESATLATWLAVILAPAEQPVALKTSMIA